MTDHHLRHHQQIDHSAFGNDRAGQIAERFARYFGTVTYIVAQTVIVAAWIALNVIAVSARWDPYPFILLNLAFSTQAAYAAPLILLAQNRQADRDKANAEADAKHRQEEADRQHALLVAIHDLANDKTPGGVGAVLAALKRGTKP
jgi:uncharacterized membrane protein